MVRPTTFIILTVKTALPSLNNSNGFRYHHKDSVLCLDFKRPFSIRNPWAYKSVRESVIPYYLGQYILLIGLSLNTYYNKKYSLAPSVWNRRFYFRSGIFHYFIKRFLTKTWNNKRFRFVNVHDSCFQHPHPDLHFFFFL